MDKQPLMEVLCTTFPFGCCDGGTLFFHPENHIQRIWLIYGEMYSGLTKIRTRRRAADSTHVTARRANAVLVFVNPLYTKTKLVADSFEEFMEKAVFDKG